MPTQTIRWISPMRCPSKYLIRISFKRRILPLDQRYKPWRSSSPFHRPGRSGGERGVCRIPCDHSLTDRSLFRLNRQFTALIDQRHAVFFENGCDLLAILFDQLIDAFLELLFAEPDRHGDAEIELNVGSRLERN